MCSGASVFVLFRDIVGGVLHHREGNASEFSCQRNQRLGAAESALEHALVETAARSWICWPPWRGVVEQAAHLRVPLLAQRTASGSLARIAHADVHAKEGDEGVRTAEGSAMEHRAQAGGGERANAFDLQDAPVRFSPSALVDQRGDALFEPFDQGGEPRESHTHFASKAGQIFHALTDATQAAYHGCATTQQAAQFGDRGRRERERAQIPCPRARGSGRSGVRRADPSWRAGPTVSRVPGQLEAVDQKHLMSGLDEQLDERAVIAAGRFAEAMRWGTSG